MNTEAALNAARQLSVDVANLTYRLALAEAIQEQLRGVLFYPGLDGVPLRRVDPEMWERRRMAIVKPPDEDSPPAVIQVPDEVTEEMVDAVKGQLQARHIEVVLTEMEADGVLAIITLLEQLL